MLGQINTALCAFGASGKYFHAPFLHAHPAFNLVGVLERTKSLSLEEYPSVKIYRTIEELLADDTIDLVVVNSINSTHFEFAKSALDKGKHVLVEKPLTVTLEEAEFLFNLAESRNRMLTVFQNRRFDGDFMAFQKQLSGNNPGKIYEAGFYFDRYKPQLNPKQHKELDKPGTGLLYDLGPHLIDQCICIFGVPQSVFAILKKERTNSNVVDYFNLWLRYPEFRVEISSGLLMKEPRPAFRLRAENYDLVIPRSDEQEQRLMAGERPSETGLANLNKTKEGPIYCVDNESVRRNNLEIVEGNYMLFFNTLAKAINLNSASPVSRIEALAQLRIINAAIRSNLEKKEIEI